MAQLVLRMLSNEKVFADTAAVDSLAVLRSFCALVVRGEFINRYIQSGLDYFVIRLVDHAGHAFVVRLVNLN